ncbi:MAG TPA: polysaccharide deacetylase, partial [Edaphobacter sp.]|nr:polysaccharide deacetylase [Edaphobacter sp.]
RRESDLEPIAPDVQQLWSGTKGDASIQTATAAGDEAKYRPVSVWWYVMLLTLVVALAETVLASGYMGTQREEA